MRTWCRFVSVCVYVMDATSVSCRNHLENCAERETKKIQRNNINKKTKAIASDMTETSTPYSKCVK